MKVGFRVLLVVYFKDAIFQKRVIVMHFVWQMYATTMTEQGKVVTTAADTLQEEEGWTLHIVTQVTKHTQRVGHDEQCLEVEWIGSTYGKIHVIVRRGEHISIEQLVHHVISIGHGLVLSLFH